MAAPIYPNHRRDRHEIRRVLAEIVIRGRNLTGSYFPVDFDLSDHQHRLPVNDNRDVGATTERTRA
jgi:hypothetical protein